MLLLRADGFEHEQDLPSFRMELGTQKFPYEILRLRFTGYKHVPYPKIPFFYTAPGGVPSTRGRAPTAEKPNIT